MIAAQERNEPGYEDAGGSNEVSRILTSQEPLDRRETLNIGLRYVAAALPLVVFPGFIARLFAQPTSTGALSEAGCFPSAQPADSAAVHAADEPDPEPTHSPDLEPVDEDPRVAQPGMQARTLDTTTEERVREWN
jgi:hypothetical protein